jgi:hypothetical protein
MLLRFPIAWKGLRRPFGDPVVDRTDDRKCNRTALDRKGDGSQMLRGIAKMFEGQQQKKIQQDGDPHPEWHHTAK